LIFDNHGGYGDDLGESSSKPAIINDSGIPWDNMSPPFTSAVAKPSFGTFSSINNANGIWKLSMTDSAPRDSSRLKYWGIYILPCEI